MTIMTLEHIHQMLIRDYKLEEAILSDARKAMQSAHEAWVRDDGNLGKYHDAKAEYEKRLECRDTAKRFLDDFEAKEY